MEKNEKFYSFKKKQGAGYNNELRECIENTCQYCIESTNKNSEDKINKPVMMLGKIQIEKTAIF